SGGYFRLWAEPSRSLPPRGRAAEACPPLPRKRSLGEPHPVGGADRDRVVVKIIGRMVQHGAVAVAHIDERAWPLFEHVGEVLGSHQRRRIAVDLVLAGNLVG